MIRYLRHTDIDKVKWDACIRSSSHPLVYAHAWYLDVVCPQWEALVLDDYQAVMPLTTARKYFISYLYQPPFTQQLGVFSSNISPGLVALFLQHLKLYKLVEINLNVGNLVQGSFFQTISRDNFELSLNQQYDEIKKGYSENNRRNIAKALKLNLTIERDIPIEEIIPLFRSNRGREIRSMKEKHFAVLPGLIKVCREKEKVELNGIRTSDGVLIAGAVFLICPERIIFLFSATGEEARGKGAMAYLIDEVIRRYAGRALVFDFEGSSQPDLARFYAGFGAEKQVYLHIRTNRLPFPLSLAKPKQV